MLRMTACLATLILNMAVLSYGWAQAERIPNGAPGQDRQLSEIAARVSVQPLPPSGSLPEKSSTLAA